MASLDGAKSAIDPVRIRGWQAGSARDGHRKHADPAEFVGDPRRVLFRVLAADLAYRRLSLGQGV